MGAKMIRRADLFKKEREAYLERQREQQEREQQLNAQKGLMSGQDLLDAKLSANTSDNMARAEVF